MAVASNFASLFEKLKVEDPWLPPRTWESIPSESGDGGGSRSLSHLSSPSQSQPLYNSSTLSEESMVRLAMYALQGVKSALIRIENLSAAFCSDPTDRTFHQIPSLWNRSSSTHALGKILNSICCLGSLVFLLHQFVDYFTNLNSDESLMEKREQISEPAENQIYGDSEVHDKKCRPYSLVNQAFAAAVGKVLEGYMCALDTLYASVGFRHSSRKVGTPLHASYMVGCLTSVVHSEITLVELCLHTKELRTWIEALGNICNLHNVALCFSTSSFEHLTAKATSEFCNFYKGGDLLTYLYKLLQVADPAHRSVLKFLFQRSCEPYCGFIRSWIFKAEISDPYEEFIVEYANNILPNPHGKAGISVDFPLSNIRGRDAVAIPCFLKDFLIPLVRAGQQVQVIMKLLELYIFVSTGDHTYEDFLPCWSGFSSSYPSYTSPVTFRKANVEAMVLARENYYKMFQEKLEYLLTKLEFRYDQVVSHCTEPLSFDTGGGCSHNQVSFLLDDSLIAPPAASRRASNVDVCNVSYDYSSSMDELSFVVDTSESSECLSSSGSEEQIESAMLIEPPNHVVGLETKNLSALGFSPSMSTDITFLKPPLFRSSCDKENDSQRICELTYGLGHDAHCHHKGMLSNHIFDSADSHRSSASDNQHAFTLPDKAYPQRSLRKQSFSEGCGGNSRFHYADSEKELRKRNVGVIREGPSYFSETLANLNGLMEQAENSSSTSYSCTLQWRNPAYYSNFLSMNPMLTNYAFLHLMGKSGERHSTAYGRSLPYFDFSSVEDPCKLCVDQSAADSGCDFGSELRLALDLCASSTSSKNDHNCNEEKDGDHGLIDNMEVCIVHSPLKSNGCNQDIIENTSACRDWEALFGSSDDTFISSIQGHIQNLSAMFEIPLDFIIEKCIQQEIMLQYKYISKLTIKLFEEGFNLQEHFLALRRYHFMEVADWADLFIKSLWDHPQKCVAKADQRLSAIQAFLEASVQRSSCEQDHYKDRLYVYMKGHEAMPLSTPSIGVRSFKFLGLGYRVDWPISIVLTPGALEIYAEIFSFLIQVKLAVFSLAGVWCSLKDLAHLINQKPTSERHENEVGHLHKLMKLRHQVNHFISTLQQYVESQLSHVSWCRFLDSLHYKVKDMLDLESLHMAYLMDCLHICFLSDKTRHVASIIENILQCALDFRSCLTGGICDVGMDQEDLLSKFSRINIIQVLAIKQTFNTNLSELHLCYLKSPKHGEFGLSCFWAYLNYNEYYSDNCNHMPVVMNSR